MSKRKATKATKAPAKIVPTEAEIAEFGYVRALIRARKAAGLVSPNVGKPRLSKKERAAAAASA